MKPADLSGIAEIVFGWDKTFLQHEDGDYACYVSEDHTEQGVQICRKDGTPMMFMSAETYKQLQDYGANIE